MLVNRCFLSCFSTTCVFLEEERKQKKTPTAYFTEIFVLKKSFKKRSHKEEKREEECKEGHEK